MSGEGTAKPSGISPIEGTILVLVILPALAFLSNELIQRRRFATLRADIDAAFAEFQARARFGRDSNGVVQLAGGSIPAEGEYDVSGSWNLNAEPYGYNWQLSTRSVSKGNLPADADWASVWIWMTLTQERSVFLRSPRVQVLYTTRPHPLITSLLKEVMRSRGIEDIGD